MLHALDLFPHEAKAASGLPIQGRILIRTARFLMTDTDVRDLIAAGHLKATDDPDEAQDIGAKGF